jgi:hypothetical protein
VELLFFRISINLTPSQYLINVSCPIQGFPAFSIFLTKGVFAHYHTNESNVKQSVILLLISNLKLCATWNIEGPMLNLTTIDQKLNLLHEVCTTRTIFCCFGNVVQKGCLEVMNNK